MVTLFFFFTLGLVAVTEAGDGKWSYKDAAEWNQLYEPCAGEYQSPVDIQTTEVIRATTIPFALKDYDTKPPFLTLMNSGYSVKLFSSDTMGGMRNGGLEGTYLLDQFHFHWGSSDKHGSEHTVDDNKYPLEMHLVHHNTKYKTLGDALTSGDRKSAAVLGVLFEISPKHNRAFDGIITALDEIQHNGEQTNLTIPVAPLTLLPRDLSQFFRYDGSLTTPGCNEGVKWTVFRDSVKISRTQMKAFRQLLGHEDAPVQDNYRPVQPLKKRRIIHFITRTDSVPGFKHFSLNEEPEGRVGNPELAIDPKAERQEASGSQATQATVYSAGISLIFLLINLILL